jgi:hypothetical protein
MNKKTIKEWLRTLKHPYQIKAINNCIKQKGIKKLADQAYDIEEAIDAAMKWDETPEGCGYWERVYCSPNSHTISAEGNKPEALTPTPNTMSKYAEMPVATPTLVFGTDVTDMTPTGLIATISANNKQIESLHETGIESPYITQQMAGLKAANAALVAELNTHAAPVGAAITE